METEESESKKMKGEVMNGTVVLMKKTVLGVADLKAAVLDRAHELLGHRVSLQLISAANSGEPGKGLQGKPGKPSYLEDWFHAVSLTETDSAFRVTFDWSKELGVPGALVVKNLHHSEFYLRTLTLDDVPGHGRVHFVCNSWVYPAKRYKKDRVFFTNQTYLPRQTPAPLRQYREEELAHLRGDGTEERHEWDRFYDYDYYNDLGDPDKGENYVRPILGGSAEFPYPRRNKTGRPRANQDPNTESRLPVLMGLNIYVPRDERFSPFKLSDAVAYLLKAIGQLLVSELESVDSSPNEFGKFGDVLDLYEGKYELANSHLLRKIRETAPLELVRELVRTDGEKVLKFPIPQVIKGDRSAWRTDEEFAREMLAGLNPLVIRRLQVFPPASKLDPVLYGNQNSSITKEHIETDLGGQTVEEAIKRGRIYIQDYHDTFMPYLRWINSETPTKTYATRTLLLLKDDGTLKPLVIELSVPHPEGDHLGAVSTVFRPSDHGAEASIWQLAKAYVNVNDSGYHQLISHWLHTHAVIEPFIIATNRQLSVLHPIYKLLRPHFKDTMNVNALSRQILNNAGGLLEKTVFPAKFSMELTAKAYKDWTFPEQALPADLIKRGMAVEDSNCLHGIRLLIEDYPYAVDGLEIWSAIKSWVQDYCSFYYKNDEMVQDDYELRSWWCEVREKGHGDKKDEPWWPKIDTLEELVNTCTIIIWVASALHAAVNFGQYPYGGFPLNRPSISRRLLPKPGTSEYNELTVDPEKAFLRTITNQLQSLVAITLIEILSRHTADEVYLGQRDTPEWTSDPEPLEAFDRFGKKLLEIEKKITELNSDDELKNRSGPVKMPYTLLFPSSEVGLTGMGIPNSVSI